jgi:hypothetical protein
VNRPRAADDFAAIRARMKELRREREGAGCRRRHAARPPDAPRSNCALAALRDGRRAVAGPTIRLRPRLGRERLCWSRREQFADQIGALAEAPRLDGSRGGECGFEFGEHPW